MELKYISAVDTGDKQQVEFKGVKIKIDTILFCAYPQNDPVYLYRKKKLVLVEAELDYTGAGMADKKFIIPEGNILVDANGDEYSSSPGVIAMAQNSRCIKGDDIAGYNQIWNGTVNKMTKAFVLGFEVPVNFVPDKLFWNRDWKKENIFFHLLLNQAGENKNKQPIY